MLPNPFSALPATLLTIQVVTSGEAIFAMGDVPTGFFYVVEGEVLLLRNTEAGDPVVIHRAFTGEFFAETSLFSDAYHCIAEAKANTRLIKIDREGTLNFMTTNARFSHDLSAYLARQVQSYRSLIEVRSIRSAEERVLAAVADGWLKGSVVSFATQIGLTHEATYRALSGLVRRNVLKRTGRGQYATTGGTDYGTK